MLSIQIMGGLVNQLFQIFAVLAYGIQHNVKIVFPYYCNIGHRHTYWDTFFSDLVIFTTQNPENRMNENDILQMPIYQERDFTFLPFPDFGVNNVCLIGYFQSFKYFYSVQDIIYRILKLDEKKQEIQEKYPKYFAELKGGESVSIHFRLGDYKQKRYYHPIMNYEYFESSLDHIVSNRPNVSRVLFFCENEDNEYVQSKIDLMHAKYPNIRFMKVDDSIPDYEQVMIMSVCHHNVLSNSTFSWWGAYFNSNDSKIVCYPSKWFGEYYEHTHDHRDMMPDTWIKITSNPIPWNKPLL